MKYSARDQATIDRWNARLKAEGLGVIETTYPSTTARGVQVTRVNPVVIPAQSNHFDRCREFAKSYDFPDATYRKVWLLYARGTSSRAIAALTGIGRCAVQWRIKHSLQAMKGQHRQEAPAPHDESGADILEVFVESAPPPLPERPILRAVRTWRHEHAAPGVVIIRHNRKTT